MAPRTAKKGKAKPFPFLQLPVEIRLQIYEMVMRVDRTIDLGAYNHAVVSPKFRLFHVCHQIHDEAAEVFYGINAFRIFSTDGKFFQTKHPLLSRLPSTYRSAMTTFELRLGPGWNKPPAKWAITPAFGLEDCTNVRLLKVFIELDPEDSPIWREWMATRTSYTEFALTKLTSVLDAVPSIREIRFDAFPSVRKDGPMPRAMRQVCYDRGIRISYGPFRGWSNNDPEDLEESSGSSKELSLFSTSFSHLFISTPAFR